MGETKDQDFTIQRRSIKWWGIWRTQFLKNLWSIWIRNYDVMNEEDDEVEGLRRSLAMKRIKISIQLSFHDIIMHDRMFALMTVYYYYACDG